MRRTDSRLAIAPTHSSSMPELSLDPERPVCRDEAPARRLCALYSLEGTETSPAPRTTEALPLLLVEQDAAMRAMLTRMLAPYYQVEAVEDACAALRAVKHRVPGLVVIDLYPSDARTLPLIQSLRAEAPATLLPIIVLTTSFDRELLLRCLGSGATNFLLKPFHRNDLLTCLRLELELRAPLCRAA